MESRKLALLCRDLAENRKAENVVVLDVSKISTVTDYFVIATGTSEPHLRAIESEVVDRLKTDEGIRPTSLDGSSQGSWLVMDFFDVIVHIMRKEVREKYDLEGLWGDATRVRPEKKAEEAEVRG
jgi:ribosome-associated protein